VTRYFAKPPLETVVVPEGQMTESGQAAMSDLPTQGVLGWPLGIPMSLHMYLTTNDVPSARESTEGLPNFVWEGIRFGDWKESRVIDLNVLIPKASAVESPISRVLMLLQSVQNNGSLWADIFLIRGDTNPTVKSPNSKSDPASVHHVRKCRFLFKDAEVPCLSSVSVLTYYLPKVKVRKEKNLLGGRIDDNSEEDEPVMYSRILF
jgi:hypothetical protein